MDSVRSEAGSCSLPALSSAESSPYSSQSEMEMEFAKACHWSYLGYPTTYSGLSAESNLKYFASLKEDPQWGRFFTDFDSLEVGERISGGSQADIYEARNGCYGPFNLVVKVMKGDNPLKAFHMQWPIGMLSARSKYKHLFDLPLITILGGTMLRDERLRGRFAFVMYRRWGDLRVLIDRRMKLHRNTPGPFPIDQAIHIMSSIAGDMDLLHNKHDIVHHDLKASNVLVWGEFGEDGSLTAIPNRADRIGCVVADFECSVGVVGTPAWMAPEVLGQLKAGVTALKVRLTCESDVYSYGMTCFEILTGRIPCVAVNGNNVTSHIMQGRRPELPHDLPEFVRDIILSCWHPDPFERPSFSDIRTALELKRGPFPVCVFDNESALDASIVKIEEWDNRRALTLLEVTQMLLDMNLSISEASESLSGAITTQYFEVKDCNGSKVVKRKSIANIRKTLCSPVNRARKRTSMVLGMPVTKNFLSRVYIIKLLANWNEGLLRLFSGMFVATDFRVLSAKCQTRKGRLECVMHVEGARVDDLNGRLHADLGWFQVYTGCFRMLVDRVTTEECLNLSRHLENLKNEDLSPRLKSSRRRLVRCDHRQVVSYWEDRGLSPSFREVEVFVESKIVRPGSPMSFDRGEFIGRGDRVLRLSAWLPSVPLVWYWAFRSFCRPRLLRLEEVTTAAGLWNVVMPFNV